MKGSMILAAAAGVFASATPLVARQSTSTDPNAPCGQQPFGYGPLSLTELDFTLNPIIASTALLAPTPSGYSSSFRNQAGSTSQGGYMGYYLLTSYDTNACAKYCNAASGCAAFNIYYERDPLLNPADACPNPASTTNIKCALWGSAVSAATATNQGQYRQQFHVIIGGSDGFNKN